MSSKQCAQCGLVNWSSAEECKRCKFAFAAEDGSEQYDAGTPDDAWAQNVAWPGSHEPVTPEPARIFSGGVKLLCGIFALEVVTILVSQVHLIGSDLAKVAAAAFIIGGFALMIVTHIWLVVRIFEQSVWWGVGTLFVPFVGVVAVIQFWQKTKRSFVGQLICAGILFGGLLIMS